MAGIGPPELLLVFLVVLLLFGATKLPELARGTGRALRIFKTEVKALEDVELTDEDPELLEADDRSSRVAGNDAANTAEAERSQTQE